MARERRILRRFAGIAGSQWFPGFSLSVAQIPVSPQSMLNLVDDDDDVPTIYTYLGYPGI